MTQCSLFECQNTLTHLPFGLICHNYMTYRDAYLEKIGDRIGTLRKQSGLTQAQLAERARAHGAPAIHRQEISQMENGHYFGSVRKLQAVLRSLRYTLTVEVARMPTVDELDEIFGDED
jgi:transcriptional regulator with XRE-family HTH domain